MSKQDKASFNAQKAREEKEAKKKLKAAEKAKPGDKDQKEKKVGKGGAKKARKWLKDFRGEVKKIVWPPFKVVLKNTGIVLVTVVIIGALVWIVDFALTRSVTWLKTFASGLPQSTTSDSANAETTTEALANLIEPEPETTTEAETTTAPAEQ
jgi:preprotein translocase subunit SecE